MKRWLLGVDRISAVLLAVAAALAPAFAYCVRKGWFA